ncbi:HTH domain-containing protein [Candidatus Woesearchaeota archaeon]|nr:HTH domain-containing protein [Candidatus Woesearchaeota archaeon]
MLNESHKNPNEDLELLRNLLTREKAKMLHVIKNKNPGSIYELSSILDRDQKSVRRDLKVLERFGFIDFEKIRKKNKISHKPFLIANKMILEINV